MPHTPLPWKRVGCAILWEGVEIAYTDCGQSAIDEDNAEYIVRACNVFELLLELTESLLKVIENNPKIDSNTREAMQLTRTALNAAKEENYGNRL